MPSPDIREHLKLSKVSIVKPKNWNEVIMMEGLWSPHLKSELVEKCAGRVEPSVKNQQLALRLFGALPQKNWMLGRCCEERISKKVCGLFSARLWEPFYVCSVVFFCVFFASFNICSTELHLAHGGLVRFVGIELLLHELGKLQVALKVPASHLSVLVLRSRVAKTCRPCQPVGAIFSGRC